MPHFYWTPRNGPICSIHFFSKKGGQGDQKMIFLKKYFQNQKGLQKLGTKHGPQAPREDFQKKSKFWIFSKKGGLSGSKNDFFEKIFPKSKRASKIGY